MIEAITAVAKKNGYQNVIYDNILTVSFSNHFYYTLLNSYVAKLLEGEIRDFSDRESQVLLRSNYHEKDISILTWIQFVPVRFVHRISDHFALKRTINSCREDSIAISALQYSY